MQGTVRAIILAGNMLPDCAPWGRGKWPDDISSSLHSAGKPHAAVIIPQTVTYGDCGGFKGGLGKDVMIPMVGELAALYRIGNVGREPNLPHIALHTPEPPCHKGWFISMLQAELFGTIHAAYPYGCAIESGGSVGVRLIPVVHSDGVVGHHYDAQGNIKEVHSKLEFLDARCMGCLFHATPERVTRKIIPKGLEQAPVVWVDVVSPVLSVRPHEKIAYSFSQAMGVHGCHGSIHLMGQLRPNGNGGWQ